MSAVATAGILPNQPARKGIPFASLLIAQALWITWYAPGVFLIIGGIRGQLGLIALWVVSLAALRKSAPATALARLRRRGLEIAALAIFVVVNVVFLILEKGTFTYPYFVKSVLLLVICVTSTVHLANDFPRYNQVGVTVTLVLGVIALVVLPIIYMNPGIARFYEYQTNEVVWFGSFGFFMTYATVIPILFAISHQQRGVLRVLLYVLCVSMVLLVIFSTFATSILMVAIGFAALAVLSMRKPSTYVALGAAMVIGMVVVSQVDLSQIPQLDSIRVKITGIFTLNPNRTLDDPNNPQVRAYLTAISVRTFLAHPLFGVGPQDPTGGDILIGNHSGIVDGLAEYGLLGLAPYLAVLALGLRRLLRAWRRDPDHLLHQARLVTFALYLIGSMVNPTFLDAGIFALVFLLALSPMVPDAPRIPSARR